MKGPAMELVDVNIKTEKFAELIRDGKRGSYEGKLKIGVDLGTANIVIAAVDKNDEPVAGVSREAKVVRDGIVVDYIGAVEILKELKTEIEGILGMELNSASTAIPPGIMEGNTKVICNVVEAAGFLVTEVVDEPTAAARGLGINEGTVVDVGGGTTGISIIEKDKVIFSADEATGGTHMTLVTAGAYRISIDEAEKLKRNSQREAEIFMVVRPVIEKMAVIVKDFIKGYEVDKIYVVGGACSFERFESVFEKYLKINIVKPNNPLLITPLGIAMYSK
jgi:ethanolamine utilization protein EutJ